MSIHSVVILSQTKQYVNLPTELLTKIRQLFGPSLATAWEVFYTESRRSKGVIQRTYEYLASKIGCSRRTVMRYVKRMMKAGLLIVNKKFHHDCNLANEYTLLTPEEALLPSKDSKDRLPSKDIDIDYSVNYLVENQNSVDKSVTNCHPSILGLNKDINNTNQLFGISEQLLKYEPKTAIAALRQEEKNQKTPKSVPKDIINALKKIVSSTNGVSNPSGLIDEAIYFVANRRDGYNAWRATGAFKKLLSANNWTTPFSMRGKK